MNEALSSLQNIQQKIAAIQAKLNEQKNKIEELETENSLLQEQLAATEASEKSSREKIVVLESKIVELQASTTAAEAEAAKKNEMKKQIEELLKEVDKCLTIINTPVKAEELATTGTLA